MEIPVPDLGEAAEAHIADVLVRVGDRIAAEDPLVSLETEKATVDVPSPAAGAVVEIKVAVGDRVSTGDVLLILEGGERGDAPSEVGAEAGAADGGRTPPADTAPPAVSGDAVGERAGAETEVKPKPIEVPDLGDFADVEVIDVLVGEGSEVEAEQGLITLETEKAAMDVPAPEPGLVLSVRVKPGDRVSTGDEILTLRPRLASRDVRPEPKSPPAAAVTAGEAAPAPRAAEAAQPPASRAAAAPAGRPEALEVPAMDEAAVSRAHASPSVRKLARELGVDLGSVRGSGKKGRIRADDVKAFVKDTLRRGAEGAALPALPEIDFARFGEVERQPLGRIRRVSAARLHASWVNVPHVTQHDEADVTALEETRLSLQAQAQARGIRLTPLAFILRACVLALGEFPYLKASLSSDGQSLILKRYVHLGFAVDTENGLLVPVIRDADRKDVYELAEALGELGRRAREGKLRPEDMQGGVFTVSSLGGIGGTFFTPIINAPEVAILGVSRSRWRPVWRDGEFVPRLMLPLSLSYDHRVIDGADAARFTTRLSETLGEVERLLEAIP